MNHKSKTLTQLRTLAQLMKFADVYPCEQQQLYIAFQLDTSNITRIE